MTKPSKRISNKKGKAKRRKRAASPALSARKIRALALEFGTIAAAMEKEPKLTKILDKHPKLAAAWERGQFLWKLKELASGPITTEEVARQLGLERDAFEELLKKDREARDLWNSGTAAARIRLNKAMMEKAEAGSPAMIRAAMEILDRKTVSGEIDIGRVPLKTICEIFGVSRVTINNWVHKGAPRNADGTYNLSGLIRYFEQLTIEKAMREPGKYASGQDAAQILKNKKTALQIAAMEKRLVPAAEFAAAKLWTAYQVTSWIDGHSEKLCMDLAGLTPQRAKVILDRAFGQLRKRACDTPDNYAELLPDGIQERFREILSMLDGENHE